MAVEVYTPDIADAEYPTFTGCDTQDPRAMTTAEANAAMPLVYAKNFFNQVQCELLAHQAALQTLGAGEFFTKDANFTIPDSVISNTTYFCVDAAGPVAPVLTLPRGANCTPGMMLNFIAASGPEGGDSGLVLIPNATAPDWIQYGGIGTTTSVAIDAGNTVQVQLSDAGDYWYVTTPTLSKINGTSIYNPKTKLTENNFVRGSNLIAVPSTAGPLIPADFPANVIETAAIDDLAVTTAKINDSAVTAVKIGNLAVTTAKINDLAVTVPKMGYALSDVTPPYTILSSDQTISNRAGAGAITLPSTSGISGKRYTICNNSGVSCTVAPQAGQSIGTLSAGTSMTLDDQTFVTLCADSANSNWLIVG